MLRPLRKRYSASVHHLFFAQLCSTAVGNPLDTHLKQEEITSSPCSSAPAASSYKLNSSAPVSIVPALSSARTLEHTYRSSPPEVVLHEALPRKALAAGTFLTMPENAWNPFRVPPFHQQSILCEDGIRRHGQFYTYFDLPGRDDFRAVPRLCTYHHGAHVVVLRQD